MGNVSLFKTLSPVFKFSDERGSIIQLFQGNHEQVNILRCAKNSIRGGHYHKLNTEAFYIIDGSVTVKLRMLEDNLSEEIKTFVKDDYFEIPPNVNHELEFMEDTLMAAVYDKGIVLPDGFSDIYIWELGVNADAFLLII